MAALSALVFTLSFWLGLHLLARNPAKPVPVLAAAGLDPTARQAWQWLVTEVPQRSLHNWQNTAARLVAADLRGAVPVSPR